MFVRHGDRMRSVFARVNVKITTSGRAVLLVGRAGLMHDPWRVHKVIFSSFAATGNWDGH